MDMDVRELGWMDERIPGGRQLALLPCINVSMHQCVNDKSVFSIADDEILSNRRRRRGCFATVKSGMRHVITLDMVFARGGGGSGSAGNERRKRVEEVEEAETGN
jgi:hypothetical protein